MFQGLFGKGGSGNTPPSRQRQRNSLRGSDDDLIIENPDDEDLQKLMIESEEFLKEVNDIN